MSVPTPITSVASDDSEQMTPIERIAFLVVTSSLDRFMVPDVAIAHTAVNELSVRHGAPREYFFESYLGHQNRRPSALVPAGPNGFGLRHDLWAMMRRMFHAMHNAGGFVGINREVFLSIIDHEIALRKQMSDAAVADGVRSPLTASVFNNTGNPPHDLRSKIPGVLQIGINDGFIGIWGDEFIVPTDRFIRSLVHIERSERTAGPVLTSIN